jgi:hypothetical protein
VSPPRRDEGQATVELALLLPAVLVVALLAVQVALVGRDKLLVVHAARAAAREAAVAASRTAAAQAARQAAGRSAPTLKAGRLSTETSHEGGQPTMVKVSVVYLAPTDVPIVGRLLPDIRLEANAAMRDETVGLASIRWRQQEEEAGTASWIVESCV